MNERENQRCREVDAGLRSNGSTHERGFATEFAQDAITRDAVSPFCKLLKGKHSSRSLLSYRRISASPTTRVRVLGDV